MFAACLVLNTQLVPFSSPIVSSGLHTSAPTGRSLKQKLLHFLNIIFISVADP
jgi:hypothetical protein